MSSIANWFNGTSSPNVAWTNPLAAQNGQGGTANGGFSTTNYQQAIQQAMQQALGGNAQGNATAQQQQQLAQQLQQLSQNGSGLAQAQLAQATGQNVAQSAAQVASLRGLNPGTAARQIASQTAGIQQQAAGQSSIQQAQEQLGALGQLGGALGTERGQDISQQNANTALTVGLGGAQTAQNDTAATLQQSQESAAAQNARLNLQAQQANTALGGQQLGLAVNLLGEGASGASLPGATPAPAPPLGGSDAVAGSAGAGDLGGGLPTASHGLRMPMTARRAPGNVVLSPGEDVIPPELARDPKALQSFVRALKGGKAPSGAMSDGGIVPGRAAYPGDDPRNDTQVYALRPATTVVPRTIAKDPRLAVEFVQALQKDAGRKTASLPVAMAKAKKALAAVKNPGGQNQGGQNPGGQR